MKIVLVAAAALINADGHVLVQERPVGKSLSGLWEFPGGKVEPGETPGAALVRELNEEIGITVRPNDVVPASFATASLDEGHLVLLLYVCRRWQGQPAPLHAERLAWVSIQDLRALAMPAADKPFADALAAFLSAL